MEDIQAEQCPHGIDFVGLPFCRDHIRRVGRHDGKSGLVRGGAVLEHPGAIRALLLGEEMLKHLQSPGVLFDGPQRFANEHHGIQKAVHHLARVFVVGREVEHPIGQSVDLSLIDSEPMGLRFIVGPNGEWDVMARNALNLLRRESSGLPDLAPAQKERQASFDDLAHFGLGRQRLGGGLRSERPREEGRNECADRDPEMEKATWPPARSASGTFLWGESGWHVFNVRGLSVNVNWRGHGGAPSKSMCARSGGFLAADL